MSGLPTCDTSGIDLPRLRSTPMNITHLGTALCLLGSAAALATACDWDSVDPRLGAGGRRRGWGESSVGGGAVGGGGVGGGGSTGEGGGEVLDCGAVDLAIDNFDDDMRDPNYWRDYADSGGSSDEIGGQLVMNLGASSSSDVFWETWGFLNLDGRSVSVEMVQPLSTTLQRLCRLRGGAGREQQARDPPHRRRDAPGLQGRRRGARPRCSRSPTCPPSTGSGSSGSPRTSAIWEASGDGAMYTKLAEGATHGAVRARQRPHVAWSSTTTTPPWAIRSSGTTSRRPDPERGRGATCPPSARTSVTISPIVAGEARPRTPPRPSSSWRASSCSPPTTAKTATCSTGPRGCST